MTFCASLLWISLSSLVLMLVLLLTEILKTPSSTFETPEENPFDLDSFPNFDWPVSHDIYGAKKAPVIGILSMPPPDVNPLPGHSMIPSAYVKWLEAVGAIVVPIPYDLEENQLDFIFQRINGLLLTGGRTPFLEDDITSVFPNGSTSGYKKKLSKFATTFLYLINKAIEANDHGDYFPIFGICLGFEALIMLFEKDIQNLKYLRSISNPGTDYIEGVGILTQYAQDSRLFSEFHGDLSVLQERIFYYHHQYGLDYDNIVSDLSDWIRPLSYFTDYLCKKYITAFEFVSYPIFGVQFHPEKNSFEWKVETNRTKEAMAVSAGLARMFVRECQRSHHVLERKFFKNLTIYHFNHTDQTSIYNAVYALPRDYYKEFFEGLFGKEDDEAHLKYEHNIGA